MTTDPLRFTALKFPPNIFKARRSTTRVVIHSLDTPPSWKEDIREVDRWHREERGWKAIGYHYVIWRNGGITEGRPLDVIGAHTEGWNSTSVAIALSGGKGSLRHDAFYKHYTQEQHQSLTHLVSAITRLWSGITVCGHADHPKVMKACPGFEASIWWHELTSPEL